jgi:hypothetical protein
MKQIWIGCLLAMILGCNEVTYKVPQPKGVDVQREIPEPLRGKYLLPDDKRSAPDTLIIEATRYFAASERAERSILGDSLIFKVYKGYYFVNINDKPEWLLRVFKQEANGDIDCYMLQAEDAEFKNMLRKLSKQVRVDSVKTATETLYQIDPSPKQLIKLIEKGYFTKTGTLKRVTP